MQQQCHNPYLPLWEHIPDGEPRVFGDRVYVFGSHDKENGQEFCELDYVTWSAPVDDLSDWRYEGVIYRKEQDPFNPDRNPLYAPDVIQGRDGRFYLFYCVKFQDGIHVAVCDTPAGSYEFYGRVRHRDGSPVTENQPYDPSVICTEEGNFLYYGFAPCIINIPRYKNQDLKGCSVCRLEDDMLTVAEGPEIVLPSLNYGKGTSFEGNEYFEGPSIRKISGRYYLVYSSVHTHQLCYAVSDSPMQGFTYGGVIVSNGDVGYQDRAEEDKLMSVGNNHGGLVEIRGQWYMFYHRHTGLTQYNRQGCAERVYFDEAGQIPQVTITTSGMSAEPLPGTGTYPAVWCCNLTNGHMGALSSLGRTNREVDFPYLAGGDGDYYIANLKDGSLAGYKYLALQETGFVEVAYQTDAAGMLEVLTAPDGATRARISLAPSEEWQTAGADAVFEPGEQALYLRYRGDGTLTLKTLTLKAN